MGIRISKSIPLGKHLRLNISRSGIGFSVGFAGLRMAMGPHGTRLTANLPGSGISYVKHIGTGKKSRSERTPARTPAPAPAPVEERVEQVVEAPQLPAPGVFAPAHEKAFARGLRAYQESNWAEMLPAFLEAAPAEPSAAILAAALLSGTEEGDDQAATLLEGVLQHETEFPTPLMDKYAPFLGQLEVSITPSVQATVPVDGLGAALLLAEVYQAQGRGEEAMGLLEAVRELVDEPALVLSLCELYGLAGYWQAVIELASGIAAEDDVTLAIATWYGRAMQAEGLHEAALSVFSAALRKKKGRSPACLHEALYWRALSYEALGKRSQAAKAFQLLYAEAPSFRDVAQRVHAS